MTSCTNQIEFLSSVHERERHKRRNMTKISVIGRYFCSYFCPFSTQLHSTFLIPHLHVFRTDSGPLSSARRLSQKGNNFARDPRSSSSGNLAKFRSSEKGNNFARDPRSSPSGNLAKFRSSEKGNNFARDPRSSPLGNLAKFRSSEKGKFSPEIPGEIHQSSRRNLTFAVKFAAGCGKIGSSP